MELQVTFQLATRHWQPQMLIFWPRFFAPNKQEISESFNKQLVTVSNLKTDQKLPISTHALLT